MLETNVLIGSLRSVREAAGLREVSPVERCGALKRFRDGLEADDSFQCYCQRRPIMLVRDGIPDQSESTILVDWRTYKVLSVEPMSSESLLALEDMLAKQEISFAIGPRARLLLFLTGHQPHEYQLDADLSVLAQSTFGRAMRHALEQDEVLV